MGVRSCFKKNVLSGGTKQHLLILATVSMLLNGVFQIGRFGAPTPASKCTRTSSRGTTFNLARADERCPEINLSSVAQEIPNESYRERQALYCLVDSLFKRRRTTSHVIEDFRTSPRNPFPNWQAVRATSDLFERGETQGPRLLYPH
jgi:hypothetical protein